MVSKKGLSQLVLYLIIGTLVVLLVMYIISGGFQNIDITGTTWGLKDSVVKP